MVALHFNLTGFMLNLEEQFCVPGMSNRIVTLVKKIKAPPWANPVKFIWSSLRLTVPKFKGESTSSVLWGLLQFAETEKDEICPFLKWSLIETFCSAGGIELPW